MFINSNPNPDPKHNTSDNPNIYNKTNLNPNPKLRHSLPMYIY